MSQASAAARSCLTTLALLASSIAQNSPTLPSPSSPGAAIDEATKAAAQDHPKTGAIDILTDTQGVDFGPYLQDAVSKVRKNWYALIPADVQTRKGKLAIEFTIGKDGKVVDMKLVATSGDVALDRAAWGGITASNPFAALPEAFRGPYLALRFRFYYNPDKPGSSPDKSSAVPDPIQHPILIQSIADTNTPRYPKKALKAKVDGIVRLEVQVKTDGKVGNVTMVEGDPSLAKASSDAIRTWRFYPARKDGIPVEDRVRIKIEFRLDGEHVKAQMVSPEPHAAADSTQ